MLGKTDIFGSRVPVWFVCGSLVSVCKTRAFNHNSFFRWSAEATVPQQDGFRFYVALVPKRRSGQQQRGKVRRHQAMAEVVGSEVLNKEEFPDEALDVARARVSGLEAALGALGESDSLEAQILRDALKARHSAQEQPISA